MTTVYEVPLTKGQNQNLTIVLDSISYAMLFRWNNNSLSPCWVIDMLDSSGNPIIQGMPLVTGSDLLAQYSYIGFAGKFIVITDGEPDIVPTFENLGQSGHLYYVNVT